MRFNYSAKTKNGGERIEGTVEADNKIDAIRLVETRGHVPISITPVPILGRPVDNDIEIECQSCRKQMQVPTEWAGEVMRCPTCKKDISIPKRTNPRDTASTRLRDVDPRSNATTPTSAMYKCNKCGSEWGVNYCPTCAHTIDRSTLEPAQAPLREAITSPRPSTSAFERTDPNIPHAPSLMCDQGIVGKLRSEAERLKHSLGTVFSIAMFLTIAGGFCSPSSPTGMTIGRVSRLCSGGQSIVYSDRDFYVRDENGNVVRDKDGRILLKDYAYSKQSDGRWVTITRDDIGKLPNDWQRRMTEMIFNPTWILFVLAVSLAHYSWKRFRDHGEQPSKCGTA
jgi:hypothetical protein